MQTEPTPPRKPVAIDEYIVIHEGEAAEAILHDRMAHTVVDPKRGVVRVEEDRWEEAQRYERRTWMAGRRSVFSDRNEYHAKRFAEYEVLRGRQFRRGIELGCGPFTNLRLILEHCQIRELHLLDPLLEDYLHHPFCRYQGGRLGGLLNESSARWPFYLRHPLAAWRVKINDARIGGLFGRPVTMTPGMIETYTPDQRFDLVVMINVLEHCRDAEAVLAQLDALLEPGGVLVFHDKLYRAEAVQRLLQMLYDAGHPLRVDRSVLDEFLGRHFTPWMRAEYTVHSEFRGVALDYAELYFIGQKLLARTT